LSTYFESIPKLMLSHHKGS